ncbi:Predicted transglutaminase-like cysteine proteinase [Bradyrhizobium sp. Rc2d]|uniref:transglutaminase-like cysteine peptidase n=1 Tax=Bradyrhizobium sp. Rc2d TaxID=1855321 RepID=UPI000891CDC0|nr:Predicted transglutaminase-like cysteine proteinase [Bradyrhizobium sp. Rc2d]
MYRVSGSVLVVAVAMMAGGTPWAGAGRLAMPITSQAALGRIELGRPTLPPLTYTMFCLRYEAECRSRRGFRGGPVRLTEERWADLLEVNRAVNLAIVPVPNDLGLAGEAWSVNPDRGDCNDYAVSKRHELLRRGWPARALLLSEVIVSSGEHHLVLLVRTRSGDLVLDNLAPEIKLWSRVPYRWLRVQMPSSHQLWATIDGKGA